MKLRIIAISLAVMLANSSYSRADSHSPINLGINLGQGTQAGAGAAAWSDSSAVSNSNSISSSISNGGTGGNGYGYGGTGGAGGISNATNQGNTQSLSSNFSSPHQAPAVMQGSLFPTAPCQGTANGFLSAFVFGGIGGGSSFTLSNCEIREEARVAYGIGQSEIAKKILCMGKYASKTPECKAEQVWHEQD